MNRAYYASSVADFLKRDKYAIFGVITANDQFAADDVQKNTWKLQIDVLKRELADFGVSGHPKPATRGQVKTGH